MAETKLEDAPQGVRAYYDKGVAAMERNNFGYAMDMFTAALAIEPRLLQIRRLLRAAAAKRAKAHPPGKIAVAKGLGSLLKFPALLKKDPVKAIETAENLLRIDPFNLKFAKAQCDAAEAAGLPEIAIQTLEILKENAPAELAILEPLATLYRQTGLFDREYQCRNQIAKLKPNDAVALKELKDAAARLTMGKAGWQKAESFRDVLHPQPEGGQTEAVDELRKAEEKVEHEPGNINHRLALADIQMRHMLYDEAIENLESCLEQAGGSDPRIERKLVVAREQRIGLEIARAEDDGNEERADHLQKELTGLRMENAALQVQRYPNDLQLKFDYGRLLFNSGQYTEAIRQFQMTQRNPQRHIRSLIYLGLAFKAKEQFDIALEQLQSALGNLTAMDDVKKEVLYELGSLYETTGKNELARSHFKEIYAVDIGYRDVASKVEG